MRGLKRKKDDIDGEKSEYKENLSHFQTMARNRESVRLKNQCLLPNSTPGYWENHLNEKIHVEAQMMRGAAKFLTACKNEDQVYVIKCVYFRLSNKCRQTNKRSLWIFCNGNKV
jgi:hypothetical protein